MEPLDHSVPPVTLMGRRNMWLIAISN